MSEMIYMVIVESADGTNQENQAPFKEELDAEREAKRLQSVLGKDFVVYVKPYELL